MRGFEDRVSTTQSSLIPSIFQTHYLDEVDSVTEEAIRQARAGAEEGTLIVAQRETDAKTRRGKSWYGGPDNLHCALVLQPDFSNRRAQELVYVAAVAAGTAICEVVAPMTGVSFGWPGNLFINHLRSGQVSIASPGGNDESWAWLILSLRVNVTSHPPNPEPECYNCIQTSGDAQNASSGELLGFFTRHFLRWINRWADDGFEPVRRAWLQRVQNLEIQRRYKLDSGQIEGVAQSIGDNGELILQDQSGNIRPVTVIEYYNL